jgi:hypothetical protein
MIRPENAINLVKSTQSKRSNTNAVFLSSADVVVVMSKSKSPSRQVLSLHSCPWQIDMPCTEVRHPLRVGCAYEMEQE